VAFGDVSRHFSPKPLWCRQFRPGTEQFLGRTHTRADHRGQGTCPPSDIFGTAVAGGGALPTQAPGYGAVTMQLMSWPSPAVPESPYTTAWLAFDTTLHAIAAACPMTGSTPIS
jgi:hypothetical protein